MPKPKTEMMHYSIYPLTYGFPITPRMRHYFWCTTIISYKAIIATTATMPAKMLLPSTLSCAPSLSAPLLLDDEEDPLEPLPWLKPLLELPDEEEPELEPEPEPELEPEPEPLPEPLLLEPDAEEPEALCGLLGAWPSVPGPAPERPGMVARSLEEAAAPEAVPAADG